LRGMSLVNAVQCQRVLRDLIVSHENGAPSTSREKMLYRHGNYVIISVMMKRLRNRIESTQIIDPGEVAALISPSLDLLRQQAFDLGQLRLNGAGPLAFFRNQGNVVAFLADLMEEHYRLATDPAIAPLRNIQNAADAYPRKRLIDYMSSKAPQI
ncbi:TPA: abortive phage resistance protein, partial [Pseudomonas aeruginosa]